MSLMPQSPRGNGPPHIRLNSGTQEARTDDNSPPAVRPSTARTNTARSLTQPIRPTTAPQSPGIYSPTGPGVYSNADIAASAELLLPPKKLKTRPYRDESPVRSPSAMSRRTSWSSDMTHDSRGPFASPFDDSRAPSRAGSEDDLNTQTVSEKFNILPSAGLLLFPEDVEKDDYLHNPDPNEKEQRDCNIFTKRGFMNVGGLAFFAIGLLVLFIGYPVLYVKSPPRAISHAASLLIRMQYFCR
jgi:beta-glucan synthesis-associated protein KRE6